jgi:hypothetical protein
MELGELGLELVVFGSFKLFGDPTHEALAELGVRSGPGARDRLYLGPLLWLLFIRGSSFDVIERKASENTKG